MWGLRINYLGTLLDCTPCCRTVRCGYLLQLTRASYLSHLPQLGCPTLTLIHKCRGSRKLRAASREGLAALVLAVSGTRLAAGAKVPMYCTVPYLACTSPGTRTTRPHLLSDRSCPSSAGCLNERGSGGVDRVAFITFSFNNTIITIHAITATILPRVGTTRSVVAW